MMSNIRKCISKFFGVIGFITFLLLILAGAMFLLEAIIGSMGRFEESRRWTSPDGKVDAVLMHYDAGATTSLFESVYIVPIGKKVTKFDKNWRKCAPVFMADYMKDRKIYWLRDKVLEIQYEKARIHSFKNFTMPLREDYNYVVEIRETPLISPPSLIEQDR